MHNIACADQMNRFGGRKPDSGHFSMTVPPWNYERKRRSLQYRILSDLPILLFLRSSFRFKCALFNFPALITAWNCFQMSQEYVKLANGIPSQGWATIAESCVAKGSLVSNAQPMNTMLTWSPDQPEWTVFSGYSWNKDMDSNSKKQNRTAIEKGEVLMPGT